MANQAAVQAATQNVTDQVARLTPIIAATPDNAIIRFDNGRTMTGRELKSLWLRIDFTITDFNYGTDRGGATIGLESRINFDTVRGYAAYGPAGANGQAGLSFLIFHEMAHMTVIGSDFYRGQFDAFMARRGTVPADIWRHQFDGDDIEFRRTEQYANIAAIEMMRAAGLTPPSESYPPPDSRWRTNENFPVFGLQVEG
jgi:hypothetical protein